MSEDADIPQETEEETKQNLKQIQDAINHGYHEQAIGRVGLFGKRDIDDPELNQKD